MNIKTLSIIKGITAWGGVFTTLAGVGYGISQGADILSYTTTLIGVALTSAGHLIGIAQANRQKEEREAAELYAEELAAEAQSRIEELEDKASDADKLLNDPDFKRLLNREQMAYAEEHQDDGR